MTSKATVATIGLLGLAAFGMAGPAFAQSSPFAGSWALDLSQMPSTYGTPPRSVTYSFADAGDGQSRLTIEIVNADGSVRRSTAQYRPDGRAVPAEGDRLEADMIAIGAPAPNVLVMSLARESNLSSVRTYAVSADGREMTESAADVSGAGAPFVRNFRYTRIQR